MSISVWNFGLAEVGLVGDTVVVPTLGMVVTLYCRAIGGSIALRVIILANVRPRWLITGQRGDRYED